jgi:hypothetical protein
MTMHLEGPWLSMGGKKKGKQKFASAEAKQRYMQLEQEWAILKKQHGADLEEKKRTRALGADTLSYSLQAPPGRETKHVPSRGDGLGTAALAPAKVYTGTEMLGIGQLHKSNAVPVFRSEDAADIARMRR